MSVHRGAGKSDSGAAMVESLVATTLLGVALVFLVGSYSTLAISSRTAEQIALAQATGRAQAARISGAPYQASGDYSAYYETLPAGITRAVTVAWWNGTSAWVGSQNANGLEKLVVTMTYDSKAVTSIELVKANR